MSLHSVKDSLWSEKWSCFPAKWVVMWLYDGTDDWQHALLETELILWGASVHSHSYMDLTTVWSLQSVHTCTGWNRHLYTGSHWYPVAYPTTPQHPPNEECGRLQHQKCTRIIEQQQQYKLGLLVHQQQITREGLQWTRTKIWREDLWSDGPNASS